MDTRNFRNIRGRNRMSLLPVHEAQARLFALKSPLAPEQVPLAGAAGRWAAADVPALRTQPASDLSAMDGYAIRFADMPGPWRVVGESAAGRPLDREIGMGEAARIFTGAALPPGADTVLVQEEAARDGDRLALEGEGPAYRSRNVRPSGLDFHAGDVVVAAGERLTPARLALAAIAGHGKLSVGPRVRVAIAATGDELVPAGGPLAPGQLPESNGLMLRAMLADLPVTFVDLGILPDDQAVLVRSFASVDADILVTTGGASVGDHDLVRPALQDAGAAMDFWRIALRPGKPLMAGMLRDTMVLGLPGNPVSSFVTCLLFVRPMIAHLAGAAQPLPVPRRALLGEDVPANGPRLDYMRAALRDGAVHVSAIQDSSMLRTLARSDCLLLRAPHAPAARIGDSVEILDLS